MKISIGFRSENPAVPAYDCCEANKRSAGKPVSFFLGGVLMPALGI